jgi:hypothetical protein
MEEIRPGRIIVLVDMLDLIDRDAEHYCHQGRTEVQVSLSEAINECGVILTQCALRKCSLPFRLGISCHDGLAFDQTWS